MDLNDAVKEAYECAPAETVYYDTLEIDCADWVNPILIVRSFKQLVTSQGTFLPVMFDFSLPETEGAVRGEMVISITGVPLEVRTKIREAAMLTTPITAKYRQYIGPTFTTPDAELPALLTATSIKETMDRIDANAMFPDLVGLYFPRKLMTSTLFPGLRA